ncbi:MAG: GNAT family N-acetyltransferase [Deltaproteobacteria bacterium]|nr:GNAT family N-acetyltransferase [Deltaproteobacteria bacterium]
MENFSIRRLKIDDAYEISKIYSSITQKPVKTDFKRLIEAHAQKDEDACFVAELDNKIIGFMISYILTLGFGIEKSAWIATLGVNPKFMGQGIGGKLAEEILKFYKDEGITNVYTSVRWDSPDLLSFFKTLGFDRSDFINLRKIL